MPHLTAPMPLLVDPSWTQSDLIQDVAESETLWPHLVEMFGERAENAPPWDAQRRYAAPSLAVYAPLSEASSGSRGGELVAPLDVGAPLLAQLRALQPKGHAIEGIPVLHVLVRGSEYEARFFLTRLA